MLLVLLHHIYHFNIVIIMKLILCILTVLKRGTDIINVTAEKILLKLINF